MNVLNDRLKLSEVSWQTFDTGRSRLMIDDLCVDLGYRI
jgi:hypothetical protein